MVKVARKGEEKKQVVSLGWSLLVEREESKVGHFQKRVEGERVAFLAGETKGCYFSFGFLLFRGRMRGFSLFWGWEKRASRKKKGKGSKEEDRLSRLVVVRKLFLFFLFFSCIVHVVKVCL